MTTSAILEEIRSLVIDLPIEDRLQLIREIATIASPLAHQSEFSSQKEKYSQRKQQLMSEQNNWFARSTQERRQYAGRYVAVYEGQIVDSDDHQRQLYLRIRDRFGRKPVLLIHADLEQTPIYTVHSPQVNSSDVISV